MSIFTEQDIRSIIDSLPTTIESAAPIGQPIHVVYGGADRFSSGTIPKLGDIARRAFADNAPDPESLVEIFEINDAIAATVHEQVDRRLAVCPIEDYRVDFEDGLGVRSDDEEDSFAANAAAETRVAIDANGLSPFFGIRIRPLRQATARRALRSLDIYMSGLLADGGALPENFVVTLPKVTSNIEVSTLSDVLAKIESEFGLTSGEIKIEFLAEEPSAFVGQDGRYALPGLIAAANGRCRGVHLGAYDLLSSFGVGSSSQSLAHPFCDLARSVMQFSTAGLGVWLSDGATNDIPVGKHRGSELTVDQVSENRSQMIKAWTSHYANCRRSIEQGIFQGWDLHPAQVPARLVAEFANIAENLGPAIDRLHSFKENSERSTLTGGVFDDAATVRGLTAFVRRAKSLGVAGTFDL